MTINSTVNNQTHRLRQMQLIQQIQPEILQIQPEIQQIQRSVSIITRTQQTVQTKVLKQILAEAGFEV